MPDRSVLRADCSRCVGLCCVAPAFSRSADFALDKPAGTPCVHLGPDSRCGIHTELRPRGFAGCTVYDCFGAGQRITQATFGGKHWREDPGTARAMFAVLPVVRQLHELLWYLAEALDLIPPGELRTALARSAAATERLAAGSADELLTLVVADHRARVNPLLLRTSEQVREPVLRAGSRAAKDHRGADLSGADLCGADLSGASLRGALLLGTDLRRADLRVADLIGADLRGADLSGADLRGSIFCVQAQLDAARGDATTRVPDALVRPGHWSSSS
ncbi:pentapeptide repeat-containing protein [Actinotalea sp. K2]|uniref:pentapeptide repeat-containing protein n=1 Tax=Actinotalea sp. K2 TaxID=2939438 RepID=UPI002016DF82|nr:pentapeptide repeat-containing protein [Actinotalea sp. K2]MCL3862567.1 pentapeptide repeat-containing protein [Actinotalea sp. K2]